MLKIIYFLIIFVQDKYIYYLLYFIFLGKEMKLIDVIFDFSFLNFESLEIRQYYKQNNIGFFNISFRVVKYREGIKVKFSKMIIVFGGFIWGFQSVKFLILMIVFQVGLVRGLSGDFRIKNLSGIVRSYYFVGVIIVYSLFSVYSSVFMYIRRSVRGIFRGYFVGIVIKGLMVFRRNYQVKENLVFRFDIEFDQYEKYRFCLGEELFGRIVFDIKGKLEIRFIEFFIIGYIVVILFRGLNLGRKKIFRDVFFNKRNYIVGTFDGKWFIVVNFGYYVLKFKFFLFSNFFLLLKYKN